MGDTERRTDWTFFPRESAGGVYTGLRMSDLAAAQQKLVDRLLSQALSVRSFGQVQAIRALESVLNVREGFKLSDLRDQGRYWLSFFGAPHPGATWAFRFEGHHVSVNQTIVDGAVVSTTPLFLGATPTSVGGPGHPVMRPLGEEEDAGRTLLASFDGDQRRIGVVHDTAPVDIVLVNAPYVPDEAVLDRHPVPGIRWMIARTPDHDREPVRFVREAPLGISGSQMDAGQRSLLSELIAVYLSRLPEPFAAAERERVTQTGLDRVHFAWAGAAGLREPHYYRIQGPTLLIEYDNVQDDADHVHAVWRDPDRDFGRDVLGRHRAEAH